MPDVTIFKEPMSALALSDAEQRLGQSLPTELASLLAETNGVEEPQHVEGVRTKLKRLVDRGWLAEPNPGKFTGKTPVVVRSEP